MNIVIADDHALVRKGLKQVLETNPDLTIAEAKNGEEAMQLIRDVRPEISILDIEMPKMNGFDVARRVHNESIPTSIIFLTMYKDELVFNKAMDIGVRGYLLKENTTAEILTCIAAINEGKYYLSPTISDFLVHRSTRLMKPASDSKGINLLTPAERKLLKLLSEMKTSQQIADALNISIKTVQNHRSNICNKLGLHGTHALLKFSAEHSALL